MKSPNKTKDDQYSVHQDSLLCRYGKITALISFPTLAFLLYQDLLVLKLSSIIIPIRGIPMFIAAAYLVVLLTPARKNSTLIRVLHFIFLFSGMSMISALGLMTYGGPHFNGAIVGMIVIIFGILIATPFGALYLAPIYLLPLVFFGAVNFYHHDFQPAILSTLVNPFIAIIATLILAEIQNRGKKNTFDNNRTIARQNNLIASANLKIQKDLELARKVQHNLIPQAPPESEKYSIYTFYMPVQEVGGDYYDFIEFPEEKRIGIIIGDVSGHGIHAALITSMVKMLVETSGRYRSSPERLLRYINDNLNGMTGENFFTAFYGIYNPDTHSFTYARGGHTHPLLIRDNGGTIELLESRGNLLGAFHNLTFEEVDIELQKGDRLLFYTDGLTEARNSDGKEFEEKLEGLCREFGHMPVSRIIQSLYRRMKEFNDTNSFHDDICIIGLEIL